jgi:hypothetical protein
MMPLHGPHRNINISVVSPESSVWPLVRPCTGHHNALLCQNHYLAMSGTGVTHGLLCKNQHLALPVVASYLIQDI